MSQPILKPKLKVNVELLGEILRTYAGEVVATSLGFNICCLWHDDNSPSATVFYDTGIFSCFSCGVKRPLVAVLERLKVPPSQIKRFEIDPEEEKAPLKRLSEITELEIEKEHTVGVLTEEPWPEKWAYRAIRPSTITTALKDLFDPSLVRLWIKGKDGKTHQERFSRLGLKVGKRQVFLRLSSEQEVRIYNSQGLSQKDSQQPVFGMKDFKVPKNVAGVILVEGPYDLLRTTQNLIDLKIEKSFLVLALLGSSQWGAFLTKFELRLMHQLGNTPIILAFDNDKAGYDLTKRVQRDCKEKLLLSRNQVMVLEYGAAYIPNKPPIEGIKDPGDLDAEGLKVSLKKLGYYG